MGPVLCGLALVFSFYQDTLTRPFIYRFHSSMYISCMQMLSQIERHHYWELEMCAVVESPQAGSLLLLPLGRIIK